MTWLCCFLCFRKSQLEEALKLFEFFRDCKEEESWISEKWKIARTTTLGKDVSQITASIQKHKVYYFVGSVYSLHCSTILEHLCSSDHAAVTRKLSNQPLAQVSSPVCGIFFRQCAGWVFFPGGDRKRREALYLIPGPLLGYMKILD